MASNDKSSKLRLCQTLYTGLSGVGDVAFNLIAGDVGRKYRHSVIFIGVEPVFPGYLDLCRRLDVEFRIVRTRRGLSSAAWPAIARHLGELAPDIIVTHGGGPGLLPAILRRRQGAQVVSVEHEPLPLRNWRSRLTTWLALRMADATVVLTDEYRRALRGLFGRRADGIFVIPNGIDVEAFRPSPRARSPGQVRLGMSGRLNRSKRFDLLLRAVAILVRRFPHIRWNLSIAGDGPDRTALQRLCEELQIERNVRFEGLVTKADLPAWFQSIDVYVHASEGEALSMAVLQAMATALPIVASPVQGIEGLLNGDEPAGILAHAQSADALASSIAAIAADPEFADRVGRSARKLAAERYSHLAMFGAYDELFKRIERSTMSRQIPRR